VTSFLYDCSYRSPNSLTPECQKLRGLFNAKEVLGKDIGKICPWEKNPDPALVYGLASLPKTRQVWIHDTSSNLWYHCCEHRQRFKGFSIRAEDVHLPVKAKKRKKKVGFFKKIGNFFSSLVSVQLQQPSGALASLENAGTPGDMQWWHATSGNSEPICRVLALQAFGARRSGPRSYTSFFLGFIKRLFGGGKKEEEEEKVDTGPPDPPEPLGPLLQCNVYENAKQRSLKMRRMVIDQVMMVDKKRKKKKKKKGFFGGLAGLFKGLLGMGPIQPIVWCKGDSAVALYRYDGMNTIVNPWKKPASEKEGGGGIGGALIRGGKKLLGQRDKAIPWVDKCIDIGNWGDASPPLQGYQVYELKAPVLPLVMPGASAPAQLSALTGMRLSPFQSAAAGQGEGSQLQAAPRTRRNLRTFAAREFL